MTLARKSLYTLASAALLLGGCSANQKVAALSPAPSPEQIESIRTDFKNAFPEARVGVVTAALPADGYALVAQIDTAGVHIGTVITFLDANQQVVANGKIVKADADGLTVKFDAGLRAVRVGDAAVKF